MRVDWCVSSWFRIKNTHSLTHTFVVNNTSPNGGASSRGGCRALQLYSALHSTSSTPSLSGLSLDPGTIFAGERCDGGA